MTDPAAPEKQSTTSLDASCFDFSLLVGHELTLYSEQFPGKPLKSKVILASHREVWIDRSGGGGLIDNLVNNQKVIIQVEYKGQLVNVPSLLKRTQGGKCRILVGERVIPLTRRRFTRVELARPVKLAVIPLSTFNRNKLAHLRWLETMTVDISGGGALIDFSTHLESPTYLFLNIDLRDFSFPSLVLGQVLYSLPQETGHFHVGLKFITKEMKKNHFSLTLIKQFPQTVFEYGEKEQTQLNTKLTAWMQEKKKQ